MRRFVLVYLTVFYLTPVLAQKPFTLIDTVLVKEVVAYGKLQKYQSGAKFETLPATQLKLVQEGGIDQLLSRLTPIYIKTDAGGLSTIHFRGTSPDHTSINFGGININSLTLGHSNLSNIPAFLFDEITLQYGSSSAVNGSGAIGGALYLGLSDDWIDGWKIQAKTTVGSFGEYLLGTKVFVGNGKWKLVTRLYGYQKENDFPFSNPYTGDVEDTKPIKDKQHGASLKNYGFLQEFNYLVSKRSYFKSSVWLQNNWYQVQPNMATNLNFKNTDEINDNSLRIWTEYENDENRVNFKAGAGYVHDLELYDHKETQKVGSDRLIGEFEISSDLVSGLGWKTGTKYRYIDPNVYAYSDSVIDFEQQLDMYLSAYYSITSFMKLTLNLRQSLVTGFKVPFTPSVGDEYILRSGSYSYFRFTSAVARSYRVPTFNDRYWGTQGNPNLKPENGSNIESGIRFARMKNRFSTEIGLNTFYMKIKNWIEWRNFGEWRAQNVKEVVTKGIEFQLKSGFPVGKFKGDVILNYTFNTVEALKTEDDNGIIGRQMNYIPRHMGNTWFSINNEKWRLFIDGHLTGDRFTDDFGDTLPAYFITNTGIDYLLFTGKHKVDVSFSVNNIFDVDYQNEKYYAMPGRYLRLSLMYELNTIQ